MRITVADLEREPVEFDERFPAHSIQFGFGVEQVGELTAKGRADLIEEHRGPREIVQDIRLRAAYAGSFRMPCARCVEWVPQAVAGEFDLIFRPLGADAGSAERAISTDETEIGYYEGSDLALEDVLREQVLLTLPAKALCGEDCKGLCPHCGHNLNSELCSCVDSFVDPRWSALSGLGSRARQ